MPLDRNQPFEEVAEPPVQGFDRSKPFEDVGANFDPAAVLIDPRRAHQHATEQGKEAISMLMDSQPDEESKARSVNQVYLKPRVSYLPQRVMMQNWPAVRDGYAKSLGYTQGSVSEQQFTELLRKEAETDKKALWSNAGPMDRVKLMFGDHGIADPDLKVEHALPMIGSEAAGTKGGAFTIPKMQGTGTLVGLINAANKFTSSMTTPENAGIAAVTGGAGVVADLANAARTGVGAVQGAEFARLTRAAVISRATQAATIGTFTAIGAKDTVNAVAEAKIKMADPKATDADKAEAIATVVFSAAMTAAAAKGTYDFAGEAKAAGTAEKEPVNPAAQRADAINLLREEAAKSDAATAKTLNQVADEIQALPPVVEKAEPTKPGEAKVEDLDGGGFSVTDKDGNRVYVQERADAEALAKELGDKAEVRGNDKAEYDRLQKEMADMGYDKAGTPAFNELWQKSEDIKNRNEGMPPETKAAEPLPKEPVPEPEVLKQAGIKNSFIDQELKRLGKEPGEHGAPSTSDTAEFQKAKELMDENPFAGKELVDRILKEPEPLTTTEGALLTREMVRARGRREAAHNELIEAGKSGDEVRLEKAKAAAIESQAEYDRAMSVADMTGKMQAQSFRIRQRMLNEDYSLAAMERGATAENLGKALPEEVKQEIADLHDRLAAVEKLQEERQKVIQFPKQGKVAKALSERAAEARARISERLLKASGESFVEGEKTGLLSKENLADLATVGADLIAKGAKEFGKWSEHMLQEFGEKIKPYLQEIFDQAKEVGKEESRLAAKKSRLESGNKKLQEKIAAQDVSQPERKPIHLDEEANRLQAQHDMLRLEYDRLKERIRYENLTPLQKAGENALAGWDSTRAILAGFEFSAAGRQGAFRLFSHPVETIQTMGDAFRALVSNEEGAHAINLKTLNDPAAAEARMNKLALIDEKASLSKQEEIYMGKLVGKIPGVKNFERFAHVFLNKVRLDMWKEFRADFPDASPRLTADFINSATGRGALGALERNAVLLNRIFFSPRFMASRIQTGSGYYIWKAALKGDKSAVKMVSRNYARSMIGYATFLSALYYGFQAYSDEKVSIGTDPRSSEFMKLKVGKTRIDLAAGVQQPLVFLSRLATQEKTLSNGKTVSIQKTPGDELLRFGRSKLNPSAGKAVDFYTGTNMVGQPATLTDLLYPATYGDIKQAFEEHDVPEATLISILAMFGAGVQTYDENAKRGGNLPPSRK